MVPACILDLCSYINYPVFKKHYFKKDNEDWLYERDNVLGLSILFNNKIYTTDLLSRDILNIHNIDNILLTNNIIYYLNNKETCKFLPMFVKPIYPNKTLVRKENNTIPSLKWNNYATFYSHINEIKNQYNIQSSGSYFKNIFSKTNNITEIRFYDLNNMKLYYHEKDTINLIPIFPTNKIDEKTYNNVPLYLSNILFTLHDVDNFNDLRLLYEELYLDKTNQIALNCLRKVIEQLFSNEDIFKDITTYDEMILLLKEI